MSWPKTGTFGLIDNPLKVSPFSANNSIGETVPPIVGNFFLLMTGSNFLLMTGDKLLLQG